MDKEEYQNKYLEFQALGEHIKQIQNSIMELEQQLAELRKLQESLESIENTQLNEEVLVLLGAGTYIKTKLADDKKVIMNIGADKLVDKSINDSISLVKSQTDELVKIHNQMNNEFINLK